MERIKLPVLVLKGLILLPKNELRLELDSYFDKEIIDEAIHYEDGQIFVVTQKDSLEETPDIVDIPSIGVIAEIASRLELPNGKTRILLKGMVRAISSEYTKNFSNVSVSNLDILIELYLSGLKKGLRIKMMLKKIVKSLKRVKRIKNYSTMIG